MIERSFQHDDIEFFKTELSVLVEKYGFNVAYMNGGESYFDAIMKGSLSVWFKQMYIKNHSVWLENNFEKQIDQRKLNEISLKDHAVNFYTTKIMEIASLDSLQKKEIEVKRDDSFFSTIAEVFKICRKYDLYPTRKNFTLIQNGFYVSHIHNYMAKENIERTWLLFEPYFKKAYLKNEMDFIDFKNYDVFNFVHFGRQKYGLIHSIEELPLYLRAEKDKNASIPIENAFFADKAKREMGWK